MFLKLTKIKNIRHYLNTQKANVSFNRSDSSLLANNYLKISEEIKFSKKPIVALESTIITHGLPYPNNLETALLVENEVRENGAIPATIAFLNGKFQVGLSRDEIEYIAKSSEKAIKISRRDISYILSKSNESPLIGGTTVSATSICAHEAKIPIFCTGGIGGVHRDFIDSMDVSADLQELARTPITVVSSGVKSILDIEKTLEYLETMGVCVVTLNENGLTDFPSFFTSKSGFHSPFNCKSEREVAHLIQTNLRTGFNTGLLVGVPIPDKHAADTSLIDAAIGEALAELKVRGIKGKRVTPFLLEKINKITKGKSLKSNVALIKNNAKVSAKIAVELHKLNSHDENLKETSTYKCAQQKNTSSNTQQITIIGGANLDYIFKLVDESTISLKGVTQPCEFTTTLGGVARNMSEALFRLGMKDSILISAIGDDLSGRHICEESAKLGMNVSKLHKLSTENVITGTYCAVFHASGEINLALGNMKAHDYITPELIQKSLDTLSKSEFCVLDADIPSDTIKYVCSYCHSKNIPVWFNPTDLRKCYKLIEANSLSKLTYISPNLKELLTIFSLTLQSDTTLSKNERFDMEKINTNYKDSVNRLEEFKFEDLKRVLKYLLKYVPFIILTRGSEDLILASAFDLDENKTHQLPCRERMDLLKKMKRQPQILLYPILKLNKNETISNVSGAGDSCSGGIISGILRNYKLNSIIYNGLASAKFTLMSDKTVSEKLDQIDLNYVEKLTKENQSRVKKIAL